MHRGDKRLSRECANKRDTTTVSNDTDRLHLGTAPGEDRDCQQDSDTKTVFFVLLTVCQQVVEKNIVIKSFPTKLVVVALFITPLANFTSS